MPYSRPTLTALQNLVASDIGAQLTGADALLRFSNLGIAARAQAGLANLHYGYLDWIARQAVPFTCTDEFLEGWAAMKGVFRLPATSATGSITFSGAAGTAIGLGVAVVRGDGAAFTTTSAGVVTAGGTVTVTANANPDPTGLAGLFGNTAQGTTMTLSQSIAGIQSSGAAAADFRGGADLEANDSLRSRMLAAYQQPPQGGSKSDYENWAKQAPGVTRAWCAPNGFGPGTVVVYVMQDVLRASAGGFPQGANGVAAAEPRGISAAGDQLGVANFLLGLQAAIGLVYVAAPTPHPVNLLIQGLPAALQAAATASVQGVLQAQGVPGGTLPFGNIWTAIANVAAGNYFTATPAVDIVCAAGQLPVLGALTYGG